jgi:AraC-like DNA-binding protein
MAASSLQREAKRARQISAESLRGFIDALDRLGYDVRALLATAGLERAELSDPDATIPCDSHDRLLISAAALGRLKNLAARMAAVIPIGAYPLLDYLVVTSPTVGEALVQLSRYFRLVRAPYTLDVVHDDDSARLVVSPGADPFGPQFQVSIVIHHLRDETEGRLRPRFVSLIAPPEDARDLERLLGCPLQSPATWSGIEFSRETLELKLRRRDPALRRVLEDHATLMTTSVGDERSVVDTVRSALLSRLGRGVPNLAMVARQLAIAPRTLQRRLTAAGATYQQVVDEARREAAERLLADGSVGVGQIAYLLGYSEPSAFHRAFKRWHEVTPQEYRQARAVR